MAKAPFLSDPTAALNDAINSTLPPFLRGGTQSGEMPQTRVRTSYAATLHINTGKRRAVIGGIQEFSTDQTRQVDDEFEVNSAAVGLPRDVIPQGLTGRTIRIARLDLFSATMEDVLGDDFTTLCDQRGPLSIRKVWKNLGNAGLADPASGSDLLRPIAQQITAYEFTGCYLTGMSRAVRAEDVIVATNVTMTWRGKRKIF